MSFGSRFQRCDFPPAGIGKEYVDVTVFLFHDGIEPVQILEARYVARDRRDVSTDEGCGLFQLFFTSSSNDDARAFFCEALSRGQANAARPAGHERHLARKSEVQRSVPPASSRPLQPAFAGRAPGRSIHSASADAAMAHAAPVTKTAG